jgi:hypothetical protein
MNLFFSKFLFFFRSSKRSCEFFWSFWSFEFFFLFRPGTLSPWRGLSRDASLSLPQSVLALSEREKPELQIGCFLFSAKEEGRSKGKKRKLEIEKKMTFFRSVFFFHFLVPRLPRSLFLPNSPCREPYAIKAL